MQTSANNTGPRSRKMLALESLYQTPSSLDTWKYTLKVKLRYFQIPQNESSNFAMHVYPLQVHFYIFNFYSTTKVIVIKLLIHNIPLFQKNRRIKLNSSTYNTQGGQILVLRQRPRQSSAW